MATSGVGVRELPEAHTFDFITSEGEMELRGVCVFITGEGESEKKGNQIWSYEEPLWCLLFVLIRQG